MTGTEKTEAETALARALATQLFYLQAIFVAVLAIAVLVVTIAVTPLGSDTVAVVGTATTSASCTAPLTCTIGGSGGGGGATGTLVPSVGWTGGAWVPIPACPTPSQPMLCGFTGSGGTDAGAR